jgi:hypothetical protein
MDPINKNPSHVSINLPAPAGSVMGHENLHFPREFSQQLRSPGDYPYSNFVIPMVGQNHHLLMLKITRCLIVVYCITIKSALNPYEIQ